jgi:hypothetical protein
MASPFMPRRATTTLSVLASTLCALTLATPASAAGRPDDCAAAKQLPAAASLTHSDGTSEVTAFGPGGGYRVTRCGRDGRALVSETVSPILDPDGGSVLVPTERQVDGATVSMLYGDPADSGWAAQFRAARAEIAAQVIPPTVPGPAPAALDLPPQPTEVRQPRAKVRGSGQLARAAVAGDACTNSQFALWESAWGSRTYNYYVNRSRFNYNDTTVASIVDGHRNWDTTYNSCGLNDITNLTSQHLGSTAATIHTYPDGLSVTDKGSVAAICPGALACTWLFAGADGRTTETDQRFNEDITFSNVGAAGAYDYESIATHETGHSIGLDHANSSNALTMYFQITSGTTYVRSLAKGDVLGLRARYP